ncbi:MAG: hypothetical protein HY070_03370, partial [Chloroflexi bacterium]|nr:hypothetical protein [Chloroflexota bacterium]
MIKSLLINQNVLTFLGILIGLFACFSQIFAPEIRCAVVRDCANITPRASIETPASAIIIVVTETRAATTTPTLFAPTASPTRTATNTRTATPTVTLIPPTNTFTPTLIPPTNPFTPTSTNAPTATQT